MSKDIVERLEYRVELSAAAGGWNVIDPKERVSIAFFIVESDAVHACKAINAVVTALCAERDAAVESRDEAREALAKLIENEARCCPEDVGFEEHIDGLREAVRVLGAEVAIARYEAPVFGLSWLAAIKATDANPIAHAALNHPALNPKPEEKAR